MVYLYLSIAIISEVIATSALKASAEFTRFYPSIIVLAGYALSFYFLYNETPDMAAILGTNRTVKKDTHRQR